jgi:hypothetical protein
MTVAFGSTPDAGQMVERRDLAGHQSGSNESRPMRYKIAELFCVRGRVKRDEEPSADDEVYPTSAKSKQASSCAHAICTR